MSRISILRTNPQSNSDWALCLIFFAFFSIYPLSSPHTYTSPTKEEEWILSTQTDQISSLKRLFVQFHIPCFWWKPVFFRYWLHSQFLRLCANSKNSLQLPWWWFPEQPSQILLTLQSCAYRISPVSLLDV